MLEPDLRGYDAARGGAAATDLPDRALLVVTGPLRQKFLQGLLSNDVLGRTPGQGCRAALMDAKGHLLAFLRVLVEGAVVRLEVAGGRREAVARALEHYRVAAPVAFASSDEAVIGLFGPAVLERLRAAGVDAPDLEPEDHAPVTIAAVETRLVRAGDLPAQGYVLHVPAAGAAAVRAALGEAGFAPLGAAALDALRIEDGRPWYGVDVGEKNLLHETGLVAEYHSPTKGCYIGQEVIARLHARGGNVSQHLRGFKLEAARPASTLLRAEGRDVGVLTTVASSPARGAIAMGYVHRDRAEAGTRLDADGTTAEVVEWPRESP